MTTGRVMALDVGKIRVGVALTDPLGYTAQPLLTLWRKTRGEDLRSLLRLIRKHEVVKIVVGNPLHMSGEVSPWAAKVHEFAEELHKRSGLPVQLWDERLSSVAAHEILNEAGHGSRNRKYVIDQVAAVVILQGWMEAKAHAAAKVALEQSDTREPEQSDNGESEQIDPGDSDRLDLRELDHTRLRHKDDQANGE